MRIRTLLTIASALALSAGTLKAAAAYNAKEYSLDLFGSYEHAEGELNDLFNTDISHGFWGGGVGLNYFFSSMIGIGADFNMSDKSGTPYQSIDHVLGDLLVRVPLGSSGFAPYVIGSGGYTWVSRDMWLYGGGVGVEMRFSPKVGIFSDGRFLWGDKSDSELKNRLLIRFGFRIPL